VFPPELEIPPAEHPLAHVVSVPGSKSITNRAVLLATMADGISIINGILLSDDTRAMIRALHQLGFELSVDEPSRRITVRGLGGTIPASSANLDIGGAGTAMRFLAGFLTLGHGQFRIDGNSRMRQRPIGPLLQALNQLGVTARSENNDGCPPIIINNSSSEVVGGSITVDASLSSQFASALLMPAPVWSKGLRLTVVGEAGSAFIDMTLRLMRRWGVESFREEGCHVVPGGQHYRASKFDVEPDATAASYFAAAAALVGGKVTILRIDTDSVQGDWEFLRILQRMGARVHWNRTSVEIVGSGRLMGVDVEMNTMPDVAATLAAIAPFACSPTRIRRIGFIRHHESDRIEALATELARIGAGVRVFEDGLEIMPSILHSAAIDSHNDHRIAMAFAVAGLKLAGLRVKDPGCVAKTYPDFFHHLFMLTRSPDSTTARR
jgi:3-phosphoshikimate 1-carboxyvinyltransferase